MAGGGGAEGADVTALEGALSDWSDIGASAFDFAEEVIFTDFAPSLARETPGPSSFSGTNQVGWDRIGGSTIAVTYFATSAFTGPEADMVINDRLAWVTSDADESSPFINFDLKTIALHEFGHFLGLGHTSVATALMVSFYAGPRDIQLDDELAATTLYPTNTGSISGNVGDGSDGVEGATVSLHIAADQPASVSVETEANGDYTIPDLIPGEDYIVRASAKGFDDSGDLPGGTITVGENLDRDFMLVESGDDDDGGGGPCNNPNSRNPQCGP